MSPNSFKPVVNAPAKRSFLLLSMTLLLALFGQSWALADEPYRLNPGDKLEISVWQEENLKTETVILPDGTISFPLAGVVAAAGKTTDEVGAVLTERLTQFISDPEVNVRVQTIEGNIIYVTGEVAHPGSFVMHRPTDVMQAIGLAGGLAPFAKKNDIVVLRRGSGGASKTFNFEYDDVKNGESLETNILLQGGDTVVVP